MAEPDKGSPSGALTQRIRREVLAAQSDLLAEEIDRFVALGLVSGPDAAATYDVGNITSLRLIKALEESGVSVGKLAAAVAEKSFSMEFTRTIITDPVALADITVAEARSRAGMTREAFGRLMLALGVPTSEDNALIREDDLEFTRMFATARDLGLSEPAILSALRSFAISMQRLADASREMIPEQVERPMLARGVPYLEMFEARTRISVGLQRLAYRASFLLQRRRYEHDIYDNIIALFETAFEREEARSLPDQAICFVDVSGFTQRTENLGDSHAANVGAALVDIAHTESTRHQGFLVKPLGDGAMLRFGHAEDAVRCALRIVQVARETGLPPVRAGIAIGPLTLHDGDYYGRTVNRAARILGIAEPGQVLVTAETARTAESAGLRFAEVGTFKLKGVEEQITAWAPAGS